MQKFPEEGLVRLRQILAPEGPLPISRSSWFAGVRSGKFPQPVHLGPRTACYDAAKVRLLFDKHPIRHD